MATCTALRERKDMVFTTRPYTGKGRERGGRVGRGGGRRGDTVRRERKTARKDREEKEMTGGGEWRG